MEKKKQTKIIQALLTIAEHVVDDGLNELEVALHYKRQVNKAKQIKAKKSDK